MMDTAAADTQDNGDRDIRDAADMWDNKDSRVRVVGLWRRQKKKNTGENQVGKYSGSRNSR